MVSVAIKEAPLCATLFELGLYSSAPEELAQFYQAALGYRFEASTNGLLGIARERRLTICEGPPRSLDCAVFAVPHAGQLEALDRRLSRAGIASARIDRPGLESGAIRFSDPDGNDFIFGVGRETRFIACEPAEMRPARMQHVVFATSQIAELMRFYREVVGFTLSDRVLDDAGQLRTAFMRCNHEHHSLAIFATSEGRLDHFCHEAGDWNLIRDWADHFAKMRLPLKWGPGRHGPGDNLFIFIHDLDGNWIEVSAELEHVRPDRPVGDWPHAEYTLNSWGAGLLRS